MVSELSELEMKCIEPMTREQLLAAIRKREDCLPPDLRERLEEQPMGRLKLLLLAARLIYALRQLPAPDWMEGRVQG
jgi:hypothetical protein